MMPTSFTRRRFQASINRSYKTVGGPWAVLGAPAGVVILGEPGSLDLFERHALLDGVLNPIANDCHHIAVFHDVELIADAPMTGDNIRSALLFVLGNSDVNDVIQRIEFALNTAASFHVDERIADGAEDIAGYDHVGAAKENQAVTIGMGRGLRTNFHRLFVKEDF